MPRKTVRLPRAGEVHVWHLSLDVDEDTRVRGMSVLSESEKRRAAGFHLARDEARFVVSHGCLRHILARYTGTEPETLSFVISEFGKPSLKAVREEGSVRFNMAHSGDAALVAVSHDREIGVDIEFVRRLDDFPGVARCCFSPRELDLLRSCGESEYMEMFYAFWTRKEAYVKARGEGMSLDLAGINVTAAPGVLDGRWHIQDLGMYRGCKCALAAEGPITDVRFVEGGALQTGGENPRVAGE